MRLTLTDEGATKALGARLAGVLRTGDVVGLEGDLGAGKSTLARACLRALADAPIEVPSPTFTLVQAYRFAHLDVWHADLYRLTAPTEVDELGLEEAREQAALLIEWPDRLPQGLFPDRLTIRLEWQAEGRLALMAAPSAWQERLSALSLGDKA